MLFRRLKQSRYINYDITVTELLNDCDPGLFHNTQPPLHCLHHILPPSPTRDRLVCTKSLLLCEFCTVLCNTVCFYVFIFNFGITVMSLSLFVYADCAFVTFLIKITYA